MPGGFQCPHRVPTVQRLSPICSRRRNHQLMLPGLRFLCAALVLSMSLLVFGFGATALLRSARLDAASLPALRAPPETVFAQPEPQPRLAMLRVEPPADRDAPAAVAVPAPAPIDPVPPSIPALTEAGQNRCAGENGCTLAAPAHGGRAAAAATISARGRDGNRETECPGRCRQAGNRAGD